MKFKQVTIEVTLPIGGKCCWIAENGLFNSCWFLGYYSSEQGGSYHCNLFKKDNPANSWDLDGQFKLDECLKL